MNFFVFSKIRLESLCGIKCGAAFALLLVCLSTPVFTTEAVELQAGDCAKCHRFQLQMIAEGGGRHSTEIGCLDCHPQHPPKGTETQVACTLCHEGQTHFEIGDCLHCHANPHKPLESLRDPLKPARKECLSCHAAVGQQMDVEPSRHAKLFCNRCHSRHKEIPVCLDCHSPHLASQSSTDCLLCHPAHQPMKITLTGYIPAAFCRACHEQQAGDLADTKTNHGGINCVYCHKGIHLSTPACQDCHGLPHAQVIHSRYKNCLGCHVDAHHLLSKR